jgi:hypothetical protein
MNTFNTLRDQYNPNQVPLFPDLIRRIPTVTPSVTRPQLYYLDALDFEEQERALHEYLCLSTGASYLGCMKISLFHFK